MSVPFLNLKAQHQGLKAEILAAVSEVLDSAAFAGGPYVAKFEEEFAAYCTTKYAVGSETERTRFGLRCWRSGSVPVMK